MIFCSTIIATIARPSLSRAVQSVLEQEISGTEFEVIVVNDSGQTLEDSPWQRSQRVRMINTNRLEKSRARNAGALIAQGKYLHFLDDDDYLLPGALEIFRQLSQVRDARLFYGGAILTDREGNHLLQMQQEMQGNCFIQMLAGEWIPLGAYIVDAATFAAIGGFNPSMTIGEDSDLTRRISLQGDFTGTTTMVLCAALGQQSSSADYRLLPAQSRLAREGILDNPRAFSRMRLSARSSYWYGRIVRAYSTSVIWNLQHRRLVTAIHRGLYALVSFFLGSRYMFNSDFWRAVLKRY